MNARKANLPPIAFAVFLFALFSMLAGMKPDLAFAEMEGFRHAKIVFKKHAHKKSAPPTKAVQPPAPSPSQGDGSAPFEPKLARLAEILGALSYLQPLCSGNPVYDWQGETMALILAEAKSELDKGSIIGAFNHGFRGYALSYRVCTPNAQKIIARFVSEGANLSQDIVNRYSSS